MRALILAAGRGSRLGARTQDRPKGLVELGGRALIDWQLAALRAAGIEQIALVRGYRGERMPYGLTYYENARWQHSSIATSLACAREWLAQDTCIVGYADLVYPAQAVLRLSAATGAIATLYDRHWLALWRRRFADPLLDAERFRLDAAGELLEIGGRAAHVEEIEGQYMGLTKLAPSGAARLLACYDGLAAAERERLDLTALFALALRAGVRIHAQHYDGWWCEIDGESDLELAEQIVREAAAR